VKNKKPSLQFETRVLIRDVMRTQPATIGSEATVAEAAAKMCQEEVGSCIVLQKNRPIGIITEQDINCKVVALDLKPSSVTVSKAMSTPLITLGADKTVGDAAHLMVQHSVRRLPVVDDRQKVVGIVTVRDILSVATEMNDIMADLITINREENVEMGICDRCGMMADDL
jgi:signal-transduction protein with cAMP-binding, CBS, and nucleotidyltransferase domain